VNSSGLCERGGSRIARGKRADSLSNVNRVLKKKIQEILFSCISFYKAFMKLIRIKTLKKLSHPLHAYAKQHSLRKQPHEKL
jgi:hypothetical protein